ncbi:hypothetical protein [Helicobacter pylori]|uniref:hypothetical protein n=1 Tax=Helicobacter pylori TaxID=210 RepID=UPI000534CE05|nr:hypothetical protein [Helicobacter pylori]
MVKKTLHRVFNLATWLLALLGLLFLWHYIQVELKPEGCGKRFLGLFLIKVEDFEGLKYIPKKRRIEIKKAEQELEELKQKNERLEKEMKDKHQKELDKQEELRQEINRLE